MDVVRLAEAKILLVMEDILKLLEGEIDYLTIEKKLKEHLDALGCELLKEILEALDQKLYHSKTRKNNWKVERRNDQKTILTPFGQLEYQRTYYKHKSSKQYSYLVDEKVGITPHMRVGLNLKAELAEASANGSYARATEQISRHNSSLKLSKQTVSTCVKQFKAKDTASLEQKRKVDALYLEADEDHISVKGKKGAQARLIYIHEGVEEGPRRRLKNIKHFTTVIKTPEQFWLEVCDYLDTHYRLDSLKEIYLSGDGASWIRVGREYIPGATFILDKFHLSKAILRATAHAPELKRKIYKGIALLNQDKVLNNLYDAFNRAEGEARKKRVRNTITYVYNNWDGIEAAVKSPHVGCSAEGHVSHVLAARMSSRPMVWSIQGAEKMASMRAVQANGDSVSEHYLASQAPNTTLIVELKEEIKNQLGYLRKRRLGKENISNVPLFNGGKNNTKVALKAMDERTVG
jgi:hypothetical protein